MGAKENAKEKIQYTESAYFHTQIPHENTKLDW